ncbi:hypothetical protein J6590_071359 [Homalodisca vitripennis]|nr:hypothetical protein J6590_071359 [Homalodisca vitripennis]
MTQQELSEEEAHLTVLFLQPLCDVIDQVFGSTSAGFCIPNYKEAEKFYQKAAELDANLAAQFDLIRLKFKLHGVDKYDPSEDFENMLQKQSQLERHNWLKAKTHILSYDLFVKRDLKKVLEDFEIIIEDNEMYDFVKVMYTV